MALIDGRNSSITNPNSSAAKQEASKLVLTNTENIDTLYKEILNKEQIVERVRNKLQNKRMQDAQDKARSQAIALANFELDLKNQGIELSSELRKQYIERELKDRHNREMKDLVEYYKKKGLLEQRKSDKEEKILSLEYEITQDRLNIQSKEEQLAEAQRKGDAQKVKKLQNEIKQLTDEQKQKEKEVKKEKTGEAIDDILQNSFKGIVDTIKDIEELGAKGTFEKQMVEQLTNSMKQVGQAISESLNKINNAISTYASYQTEINARLQGVGDFSSSVKVLSDVAYSPLVKTEELYTNLSNLVAEGIASNVEQKAFLQTVKKGIATTFDVNTQALKNIIKVQQFDSTAARLGMEGYLTRFLNEFARNTEYLSTTFDSVTESLLQASSLMSGQEATQFEFIVQKWLGALTGMGFSENTAKSIATAIGQLGSGDISGLSSSQMQNLMVMAASRSGNVNFADMLTGGLTNTTTNYLMESVVTYLQELGSYENNVVKSQLAQTFGVSLSDLMAVQNLSASDMKNIFDDVLTYKGMYNELSSQMGELRGRMGIANILENLFSNLTFQTGMNIASNPAMYATWKITDLIQGVTGGINIPFISAMGTGFDLNTTVENLIKLGIVGASTLGNIGDIISGISSGSNGADLLGKLGIGYNAKSNSLKVVTRGGGLTSRLSGVDNSLSTMVGNTEGSDYYNAALTSANDDAQSQLKAEAQTQADDYTEKTYTMLEDVNFSEKMTNIDKNIGDIYHFLTSEATYMSFSPTLDGLTTYGYD